MGLRTMTGGTFFADITVVSREIGDINAYPRFWGVEEGILQEMCKWQICRRI